VTLLATIAVVLPHTGQSSFLSVDSKANDLLKAMRSLWGKMLLEKQEDGAQHIRMKGQAKVWGSDSGKGGLSPSQAQGG
jgi:hypothetical protein